MSMRANHFFKSFFIKELACSVVVHIFFDWTRNTADETAATF